MTANGRITLSREPDGTRTAYATPEDAEDDDKVEFAEGVGDVTLQPTTGQIALTRVTYSLLRREADNALSGGDEVSTPDTGPAPPSISIEFKATSAASGSAIARLRDWIVQDNAPNSRTRRGRISIKSRRVPSMSLYANAEAGLKARSMRLVENPNNDELTGTLVLVLDGKPSRLGTESA